MSRQFHGLGHGLPRLRPGRTGALKDWTQTTDVDKRVESHRATLLEPQSEPDHKLSSGTHDRTWHTGAADIHNAAIRFDPEENDWATGRNHPEKVCRFCAGM